jgi:hypothetical protein
VKPARGRALAQLGAATLTCVGLLAACSLTTSLDGLTGGATGGADDGGADQTAVTADGAVDGVATSEGGNETGALPDSAPPVPFCDSLPFKPTFCDDFERTDPKGAWENVGRSGGGSVALGPSTRTPTGRELVATIPIFAAGNVSVANLTRTLVDAQQVTLSYSMRIDAAPTQGQQQVMLLSVTPSDGTGDFFHTYLFVSAGGVSLVEQTFPAGAAATGTFVQSSLTEPILFGAWQRVRMTLKLSAPTHVSLAIDGKAAFDGAPDALYRPGTAGVSAGIHYSDTPSGPLSVHVDDLYVDLK